MRKTLWLVINLLIVLLFLGGCGGSDGSSSDPEPEDPQTVVLTEQEQAVLSEINQYRASKGLQPLRLNDRIIEQARNHSRHMALGQVPFGHSGFEARVQATGLQGAAAENVAFNYGYGNPSAAAVEGWIHSDGHRRNIEGNYNLTGIGVVRNDDGEYYFTQIFMLVSE